MTASLILGQYVALRQLSPLWWDLHRAMPGIALDPPSSCPTDVLSVQNLNSRLYRRVLEIRDGLVKLQPYSHRAVVEHLLARSSEGKKPLDSSLTAAAIAVIVALEAHRQARGGSDGNPMLQSVEERALESEVHYLCQLTHAYGRLRTNRSLIREAGRALNDLDTEGR